MKTVTIILALLFAACVTVTVIVLMTSGVTVSVTGITAQNASENPALFAQVLADMGEGAGVTEADMADCTFYTWRIEVDNSTFVRLEMLEAAIETKPEDIASLGGLKTVSVGAHSQTELAVTVLTRNPDHPKRELTVSWYLWGQANRRTLTVQ